MKDLFERINCILTNWDPIGVGGDVAVDEYKGYIPLIIKSINSKGLLMRCLEDILKYTMGLKYDPHNKRHFEELHQICDKIIEEGKKQG